MSTVVSYEVVNGIGVVTVANPPVNALSHAVRQGLLLPAPTSPSLANRL